MSTYWLMKSEPDSFSIDDLARSPRKTTFWDGVRNFQVRNMFRDHMMVGDGVLFYHSSTAIPGVVGLAKVASGPKVDPTQFDPDDHHYDPASKLSAPRWMGVDVKFTRKLRRVIPLSELRAYAQELGDFPLIRKANRLSVMPVSADQWEFIISLE